ncbi:S8 family serine peptidase [Flavisolibacter tropicus]|uniref:Fibronectin type-III domain-containing protein n=1 Tax=Flavisolibacter tropicus TaxID=1492898 RepID=A0A172U0B0_9BACT|nr:S8 family serine peptidase [Flavisolibacter tropicus]ANE52554.1 hypothetical protein SY85_20805 [Flavisolibacter tropicus]
MMLRQYFLLTVLLGLSGFAFAQKEKKAIRLKSGVVYAAPNIITDSIEQFNKKAFHKEKAFAILQFETIPNEEVKQQLAKNGVALLDYIPDNAYTVSITKKLNKEVLQRVKASAIWVPTPQQKMHPSLAQFSQTVGARSKGLVTIQIRFPQSFTAAEVLDALFTQKYNVIRKDLVAYHILSVQIPANQVSELAALPFVEYLQEESLQAIPLNGNSRRISNATILNASLANGGKNLNGAGVVIGHGDDGNSQGHVDYTDRVISKTTTIGGGHSTYVAGNLAGAGIWNELYRGYASKAKMISTLYTDIWWNAATYVQDYGMVLTNNSYQIVPQTCDASGVYDGYSALIDQQAFVFPSLQQVFASGNHGGLTCSPYAASGFGTIAGSLQCAKNAITVGNINSAGIISGGSSRGPVRDGRIKPELVTLGVAVTSTSAAGGYLTENGTSISAPAVTGGAALMYEKYRQLNSNANPSSALIKALLCNGATDRGTPGPDYVYGFGSMNLLRSVDMLEKGRFIAGSISNGGSQTTTISVPANTARLKVMIYWNDPAASPLSASALVHDLDLEVTDPSSTKVLPLVLDPSPANVQNPSTNGADHRNNIEQVVINNPTGGTYTFTVKGTSVTQNPTQDYYIVYDIIPNSLALTFPVGGEGLIPGQVTPIQWESYGDPVNSFTLEYSIDGGTTWTTIDNAISATADNYTWTVPAIATEKARIRVTKNGTSLNSTSNAFAIIGQPTISLSATQCPSYIAVQWGAVANASDYEIIRLKGGEMVSVGTTTGTSYTISSLSPDSVYWVSVRARVNGAPGLRSVAISRQPNTGTCTGTISDNDLKLDAILTPTSGRKATSSALTSTTPIKVRVRNLDDVAISNFSVKYSIDGGSTWVTEAVTATIPAQGTYEYTFAATANLAAIGNYNFVAAVVNNTTDPIAENNTLSYTIKHLDNPPVNLATDLVDDFEAAVVSDYRTDTIGLSGIDRYDFMHSSIDGRLRTFVNTGIAASGTKAITLDADRALAAPGNTNYLIGTYNLASYTTADDIRLSFKYNQHGQTADAANKVWIRGNDNSATPWIEVYDLYSNQNVPGTYKNVTSIELSSLLQTNGQTFSSSFQIRWGQAGQNQAANKESGAGYTFDDIKIYRVQNDMQLVSINGFAPISCALSTATPITVSVRNTMNATLTNIPIKYRVNGGAWVSETMASVAGKTTVSYTFAATANLSAVGAYTIEAVVDLSGDSFADNNSAQVSFLNEELITTYPYLQDFETDNGNWYSTGTNNSWAWGAPASVNINRAASGSKAWKTNLSGNYNDGELSFLYSPCFNIAGMTTPMLSFSVAMDIENCGTTTCDAARVEYSVDGTTWNILGTAGSGTNWYNRGTPQQFWSTEDPALRRWHVASIPLPTGINRLRLRFVFASDGGLTKEGLAVDDIHIYDRSMGIYNGPTMATSVQQTISGGSSWIDFQQSGALVASVQPNNQNLGATDVQAYINSGAVRNINNQYYANRNITVKPSNTAPGSPVKVRFYFTDAEAQALITATGCATCSAPASPYQLGVSKMSHSNKALENGTVVDDGGGIWSFIPPTDLRIVPFDIGYYAEFEVNSFSEFWLNSGGLDAATPLPINLISFTGQRNGENALLRWTVTESNISKYEIEASQGATNQFIKIGEVVSQGSNTSLHEYNFTDVEPNKLGIRYYRLKIIEEDGTFSYSPIRSIIFANPVTWMVYPNPSNGKFYLTYQLNSVEKLEAQVFDAKGRLVQQYKKEGNGGWQKLAIDLSSASFPSGVYLLRVTTGDKLQSFKLNKQ